MRTYLITLTLRVSDRAEHLHDARTIRAEVTSWLEDLGARVDDLHVEPIITEEENR